MTTTPRTPVSLLKAQLRLDNTADEDSFLTHKLATAEDWIRGHIGADLPDPMPPAMTEAALMIAAHLYECREAVSFGLSAIPVPFGAVQLLQSYREEVTGHVAAAR